MLVFLLDYLSLNNFSIETAKRSQNFIRSDPRRANRSPAERATILVGQNPTIVECPAIVERSAKPPTGNWSKFKRENTGKDFGGVEQIHATRVAAEFSPYRKQHQHATRRCLKAYLFVFFGYLPFHDLSTEPAKCCQDFCGPDP